MCGIAISMSGVGRAQPLDLGRLAHRGPDAVGEWTSRSGHCWMGHVRLAILELSPAGAQPMVSACGKHVIIFNGEIYNHLDLRKDLDTPRGGWRGMSDTETLLEAYCQIGEAMLDRLNGMFAFAIINVDRGDLFAAVDRFAMKPLYFRSSHEEFQLCSETRLLVQQNDEIPRETLAGYLRWGCLPVGASLWSQIRMLQPGKWLRVGADLSLTSGHYWGRKPLPSGNIDSAGGNVRRLVEKAVDRHLLSDVPVAAFLSGGVDSSIVATVAAKRLGRFLDTFCLSFGDCKIDESQIAYIVAKRAGASHHRIPVTESEALAMVPKAVSRMDSPSVDAINTYMVSAKVREFGIKVALSGLGGDELFGGYPSFRDTATLSTLAAVPGWLRGCLGAVAPRMARIADLPSRDTAALARWRRSMATQKELAAAGLASPKVTAEPAPALPDPFAEISWQELFGYMSPMLLRDSDQMSMAVSLEIRVPFLDKELTDYVIGLPYTAKRGSRPKQLLIDAFKDDLPMEVWNRPKQGFELPMEKWMHGPLRGFVAEGMGELESQNLFNGLFLRKRISDFEGGKMHWTRLWSLVVLGHYIARNRCDSRVSS